MNLPAIESIACYLRLSDSLATAGQPTEEELAAVAAAGFEVVINLALHDDPSYSLKDEEATVGALGLNYVHIPVQFNSPRLEEFATFSRAMERAGERKVFVHCRHNKRVPVFVALDRILRQGWAEAEALELMRTVWQPDATWERFIELALSQRQA